MKILKLNIKHKNMQEENSQQLNEQTIDVQPRKTNWVVWVLGVMVIVFLAICIWLLIVYSRDISSLQNEKQDLIQQMSEISNKVEQVENKEEKNKTVDLTDQGSGGFVFNYPVGWEAVFRTSPLEGGILYNGITFAEKEINPDWLIDLGEDILYSNDLNIDYICFNDTYTMQEAHKRSCSDRYDARISSFEDITLDGKQGTIWKDLGGMASNPTLICIKTSDNCFLEVERENDMFANQISDEEFEFILDSIKFE